MSRIYVSSTYRDLADHRAAVSLAVRRLGHVDVAMEHYVAEDLRPVDRCLADVGSSDLYVGLFARRYGFCPDGGERSITELEFRRAVRDGVPSLCFLLDDDADWPAQHVEGGAGAARLAALRDEIAAEYLAGFFTTPDELAAVATASIVRALDPESTPFDPQREVRLFRDWRFGATPRERERAKSALARMGSPRYTAEIKRLLLDADERSDVELVAEHLDELQRLAASRRELMPILLDLLAHGGSSQRYFVVFHLGELALAGRRLGPEIVAEMVRLADDEDPGVRGELAHALGKLTASDRSRPEVRPTLDRLAAHDDRGSGDWPSSP